MNQLELTNSLAKASELYYAGQTTEYTDTEFDLALKELQKMEKESGVVYPNSPTQRVGSDIQTGFAKGKHPKPMLTIENAYNQEDIEKWIDKMVKLGARVLNYSVKYDGISCELKYENGLLTQALTRGDKNIGDDITNNVRTIKSVPLDLRPFLGYFKTFYVRGEVLLPKSKLKEINEERIANGEQPFSNTRNACSGSIKQLDSRITAGRGLIFRAWDCFSDYRSFTCMWEKTCYLRKLGFVIEADTSFSAIINGDEAKNLADFKELLDKKNFDFDYDGVVIKVEDVELQDKIGIKDTRAIEWGIARKWNEDFVAETKLKGVDWQVGRTGVLTPVGRLEPVECAGVVISNVTLNNIDFIKMFDLHINDTLKITRSGGVIPYVLGVNEDKCKDHDEPVSIPDICPICGSKLVREGALLKCVNDKCSAIEKGKIIQFCSKDCADVKDIGESVVEDLYRTGIVRGLQDLLRLGGMASETWRIPFMVQDWLSMLGEGYGEKSVTNILENLAESVKNTTYDRLLSALSIPGVGKVMGRVLASKYPNIQLLKECTVEDLVSIDGVADIMANNIYNWIQENKNGILHDIEFYGWATFIEVQERGDMPLDGLTVVFSGSSSKFKGDEVEDFLTKNGAKCGHSVSKKTNYLIIGEKPGGSKVSKAEQLGVEIIKENDFYEKYGL